MSSFLFASREKIARTLQRAWRLYERAMLKRKRYEAVLALQCRWRAQMASRAFCTRNEQRREKSHASARVVQVAWRNKAERLLERRHKREAEYRKDKAMQVRVACAHDRVQSPFAPRHGAVISLTCSFFLLRVILISACCFFDSRRTH